MRAVFVKSDALGDVIRNIPVARGIVGAGYSVDWYTSLEGLELLSGLPGIRPLLVYGDIAARNVNWVINLEEDNRSAKFALAFVAPRRSGAYLDEGRLLYTEDLSRWFGMGLLAIDGPADIEVANGRKRQNRESYLNIICSGLGIVPDHKRLHFRQDEMRWAQSRLDAFRGTTVGVFLGGADRWQRKALTVPQASRLIEALLQRTDVNLVLVLGPKENALRGLADFDGERMVAVAPPSLRLLGALLAKLDALITTDSAPLHLAGQVGVPVVALFGPTSADEVDLLSDGQKIVASTPCARCYERFCSKPVDCRETFTPEAVLSALGRILQRRW